MSRSHAFVINFASIALILLGLGLSGSASAQTLTITTGASLGTFNTGTQQIRLAASGGTGTYTWAYVPGFGNLPDGLTVRSDVPASFAPATEQAGLLGVATAPGNYSFRLSVTSGTATVTRDFTMRVTALTVADPYLPDSFAGVAYSWTMTPVGNAGTVTFSVQTGKTLPSGLSLSAAGKLSGTISTAGTNTIFLTISDGTDTVNTSYSLLTSAIGFTSPNVLPNATQFSAYNGSGYQVAASGGSGSYTYTLPGNALPTGLSMTSAGLITGTPTAAPGLYQIDIKATDTANSALSYQMRTGIVVVGSPVFPMRISSILTWDFVIGNRGFFWGGPNVNNGGTAPFHWTVTGGSLPPGLAIRNRSDVLVSSATDGSTPGNAEIWGSPTATGTYHPVVTVTDANGATTSATLTINVSALDVAFTGGGTSTIPTGTIGTAYSQTFRILGGTGPYTGVKLVDGNLPAGLALSGLTLTGTPTESGNNISQPWFQFSDSGGNTITRAFNFTINNSTTSSLRINGAGIYGYLLGPYPVNVALSQPLSQSGANSATFSLPSGSLLPAGVALSAGGQITGTPNTAGTYDFLVQVTDNANSLNVAVKHFRMIVSPMTMTTTSPLNNAFVGTAFSQTLAVTGNTGAVTWSETFPASGYMPPGLALSAAGVVSGTPTSAGQYIFYAVATDSASNAFFRSFTINIYISTPPLTLSSPGGASIGPFLVGPIRQTLQATGGTPPYHYSLTPGFTLPSGLRIQDGLPLPTSFTVSSNGTGGLLGVVTAGTTVTTSIRVTDAASATYDRPLSFTVVPITLVSQTTLPRGTVGAAYSTSLLPVFGSGTFTFSSTTLPPGLTISGTGVISGTPTTAGSFTAGIVIGDAAGGPTVTVNHTIVIGAFAITDANILPSGTVNSAYSYQFNAPSCGTGCAWSVTSGTLPGGVTLSSAGLLSGTPTNTAGYYASFTVQAAGSAGTVQKIFTLVVPATTSVGLVISTNFTTSNLIGNVVATSLSASGGTQPYTWSLASGTLPTGLSVVNAADTIGNLAPGIGYLSGRLLLPGSFTFALQVKDATGLTATKSMTYLVSAISVEYTSLPISGTSMIFGQAYSQQILVIGGTGTYNSFTSTTTQPIYPGLTLNSTTGVVSGTPANTGSIGTLVQVTDSAGSPAIINLTIAPTSNGTATVTLGGGPGFGATVPPNGFTYSLTPAGGTAPYTLSPVGTLPSGVVLYAGSASLSSATFSTGYGMLIEIPTPGTYTFTVGVQDSAGLAGAKTFTVIVPTFTTILGGSTAAAGFSLQNASVGVPYSQQLYSFSSGTAPTFSLTAGAALPPGLSLSANGLISGTPTKAGTYLSSITLTDATGTLVYTITIVVSSLAITSPSVLPTAINSLPYTYSMTATGGTGTLTWSATGQPAGLTMATNGVISGTPTSTGRSVMTVTVTDGVSTFSRSITMWVELQNSTLLDFSPASAALADASIGQQVSYNLTPTGGKPPYTWAVTSGSTLPPGFRLTSGSTLSFNAAPDLTQLVGAGTTAGLYTFSLTATDSAGAVLTRTFTLNVTPIQVQTGAPTPIVGTAYSFQLQPYGGTGPYTYTPSANSLQQELLPPGLTLSSSGLVSGTPTSTGAYAVKILFADSAGHTVQRTLSLTSTSASGLNISSTNFVNGYTGFGYFNTLALAGGVSTYTFSQVGGTLPPGLSITPAGVITGQATTAGTYTFTIRATNTSNAADYADHSFTYPVSPIRMVKPLGMDESSANLPSAQLGTPYSYTLGAAGGTAPYTFTLSPFSFLPPGMTLSSAGVVSGTPAQSGVFNFVVTVTDSSGSVKATSFSLLFWVTAGAGKAPPLVPRSPSSHGISNFDPIVPDASVGAPYFAQVDREFVGGTPPYSWSLPSGSALPAGLALFNGTNGTPSYVAGIPTAPVIGQTFTYVVADSAGQSFTGQGRLSVSPISLTPDPVPTGKVGTAYGPVNFAISGGVSPYNITLNPGFDVPPGLTLTSSGVLSGTPTAPGYFAVVITVTDSLNNVLSKRLEMFIDNAAGEVPTLSVGPQPVNVLAAPGGTPPSVNLNVKTTSGSTAFTAAFSGVPGGSLTTANGTTNAATTLNFTAASVASAGTYFGLATASAPASVNGSDAAPVTLIVAASQPPVTGGVTPSFGSGTTQTFTATWTDAAGASTISIANILFNTSASGAAGCLVEYNQAGNTFRLLNDAGNTWLGPITLGTSGSLNNTQCTISGTGASSSAAGSRLAVTFPITFGNSFTGLENIYLLATNNTGLSTPGFIQVGTWSPTAVSPQAPTGVSVSPPAGSGLNQTFTASWTDAAGAGTISLGYMLINTSASGTGACLVEYNQGANTFRLINNAGDTWLGPITLGSGSLNNSQCTISGAGATVTAAGSTLSVAFPISFKTAFAGTKNVYLLGTNNTGLSGASFAQVGTWTVTSSGGPKPVSLSPPSGTGTAAVYTGVFNHTGGTPPSPFTSNHYLAYMLLLPTPNVVNYTAKGSCLIEYNVIAKGMRLVDDAGTDWIGGPINSGGASSIPLTTGGTISNSVCTVNIGASAASLSGNLLTVNYSVSFASGFTGRLATFLQELDVNGNWAGVTQFGNWTANTTAAAVTGPNATPVTPSSGAGSSATFTTTISHSSGLASNVFFATILVSSSIVGSPGCQVFYYPGSNNFNLGNDAGPGLVIPGAGNGVTAGTSFSPVSNSRCSITAGSVAVNGNSATLSVTLSFIPATFAGPKNVYSQTFDYGGTVGSVTYDGLTSHWVSGATWTVQ